MPLFLLIAGVAVGSLATDRMWRNMLKKKRKQMNEATSQMERMNIWSKMSDIYGSDIADAVFGHPPLHQVH